MVDMIQCQNKIANGKKSMVTVDNDVLNRLSALFFNENEGTFISSVIVGICVGALMKNKFEDTGISGAIAFISGFVAFLIYARLIYFANYESGSFILTIFVAFAPFVFVAYILISQEADKKRVGSTIADATPRVVTDFPNSNEVDQYFIDAGRLVIEKNKASIGMLQTFPPSQSPKSHKQLENE